MIFFKKPLVCYISGNFLEVFETNNNNRQRLSFSSESIQYSEVINEKRFTQELQRFIGGLNLKKGKGIVLLSAELVYLSDIDITGKNEKDETEEFLATVPLSRTNIATILLHNKNKSQILAANKKIYECVVKVLEANNIEIFSVAPAPVFTDTASSHELTAQEAKKIAGKKKILQKYNFLQSKQQPQTNKDSDRIDPIPEEEEKKGMKKQLLLLVLSLLLLTGAAGYYLTWSGTISSSLFKKPEPTTNPEPTTTIIVPSVTSQLSPTAKPLSDKSVIKIQILNGSGIEGQAGKLGSLLQEVGYENIATGNTDNLEERTIIVYNKLLSKDVLTEITSAIEDDFPDPTLKEASQAGEFDILITTGRF